MKKLAHADAFQVLLLQAAYEGRGDILFGESLSRARTSSLPFMVGKSFPNVYLEHPLIGEPFLDVTVLLGELESGTRIASKAATGTEALLDWYAKTKPLYNSISFGYELDTKEANLPNAAVHFQPRKSLELVQPFFEAMGEPERARLYLDQERRMPRGWPLSFFGLFRGRPGSPLRVCGYHALDEADACAHDSARVASVFDELGFSAYDDAMLKQVSELFATVSGETDFQFDVYPDGSLGSTFAIDMQFRIERPEMVQASFRDGRGARVMNLLKKWGIADDRWSLAADAAFARALPVELDDGTLGRYSLTLMPQWAKVRWCDGVLQPAKLYLIAHAGVVETPDE